jgi:hypothetical protein
VVAARQGGWNLRTLNLATASADQWPRSGLSSTGIPAVVMAITLQSTVGGFSSEFMRKLPQLEQAMLAHGLEPSEFAISKDRASPETPWIGPFFYSYTVFFGEESFNVTEPNDLQFYDYFYDRCIAEGDDPSLGQGARRPGLISRLFRWMAQPI